MTGGHEGQTMATTREQLRRLVDTIPDDRLDEAKATLTLLNVPDDEPVTAEDLEAIARGARRTGMAS
jgi:hypothetical protein